MREFKRRAASIFNPKRNGFFFDLTVVSGFCACIYFGFIQ